MRALVGAEFLKLRTTRGWIGFVLAAVLLSVIAAGSLAGAGRAFEIDDPEFQRDLLSQSVAASLVSVLIGIASVTVEWRYGTITRTFLATPRRFRVLTAKGIAVFLIGAGLAALSVVGVLAVAVPVLSGEGARFEMDAELAARIGRIVLAAALWGAIGVGVGALLKGQALALVTAILWVLVLEALIGALLHRADLGPIADVLPRRALSSLDGSTDDAVSPVVGGLLGALYVGLFGAVGYLRVARSDIT